jgi:hypothetical protein
VVGFLPRSLESDEVDYGERDDTLGKIVEEERRAEEAGEEDDAVVEEATQETKDSFPPNMPALWTGSGQYGNSEFLVTRALSTSDPKEASIGPCGSSLSRNSRRRCDDVDGEQRRTMDDGRRCR